MHGPSDPMERMGYNQIGEDVRQGRRQDVRRLGCITSLVPVALLVTFVVVTFAISLLNDVF